MTVNISENHFDTRISLNRVLASGDNKSRGLVLRGNGSYTGLIEYFGYNAVVKNLCSSQYYHWMDFFSTYTCKKNKHFGVKCKELS